MLVLAMGSPTVNEYTITLNIIKCGSSPSNWKSPAGDSKEKY